MFHLNPHRYYPYYPGFSDDIAQEISEGFTVTYAEIQMAAYMGFKEIYLLGVDFNYSKILDSSGKVVETGSKDYFSDSYILVNENVIFHSCIIHCKPIRRQRYIQGVMDFGF